MIKKHDLACRVINCDKDFVLFRVERLANSPVEMDKFIKKIGSLL